MKEARPWPARDVVLNVDAAETMERFSGKHFGARCEVLTPSMGERGGRLGVNRMRVPPGRVVCPAHAHHKEDEAFFVLSGRGTLRYGDERVPLRAGDCISCPAGTGIAHQIANTGDEELVYLAIGTHDPDEVCLYPDSGKVLVRALGVVGRLERADYLDGEPERPRTLDGTTPSE